METNVAMYTAINEAGGAVTAEQMNEFREQFRLISRFHQWPTLNEYRDHVARLKVEAAARVVEDAKERARAEQQKIASDVALYRRMKGD